MVRTNRSKRRQAGLALLDSLIGAIILVLGSLTYFSLVPVVQKSQVLAAQRSVAIQICNRVIEHVQLLKPKDLNAAALSQLNLIDAGQTQSPYTFTALPLDDGSFYSPRQSLQGGAGTMTVTPLTHGSVMVQLTLTWTGPGGNQSYTTGTILGGYR